jgi:uncharacterized protein involved in copper resistance
VRSARAHAVGQLVLGRLLDDAVVALQRADRLLDRHRVADLDGEASVGRAWIGSNAQSALVGQVERVGGRACATTMRGRFAVRPSASSIMSKPLRRAR